MLTPAEAIYLFNALAAIHEAAGGPSSDAHHASADEPCQGHVHRELDGHLAGKLLEALHGALTPALKSRILQRLMRLADPDGLPDGDAEPLPDFGFPFDPGHLILTALFQDPPALVVRDDEEKQIALALFAHKQLASAHLDPLARYLEGQGDSTDLQLVRTTQSALDGGA